MGLERYMSLPLLVAAVALLITSFLLYLWNKNRNLPPGPWGLPILGYYPFINTDFHLQFSKLAKRYGDVFSFRTAFGTLIVILNGSKIIKDVLVNRSDEFIGRAKKNMITWISDGIGITQEEGSPWKEQRRFFLHTAKNFGVGKLELENLIHDEIKVMLEDLHKTAGKPTNVKFHYAYAVSSVVSMVLFNKKYDKTDPEFKDILSALEDVAYLFLGNINILVGIAFDIAMWLSPFSRRTTRGRNIIRRRTDTLIDEHLQTFDPDHPRDYVDAYLSERNELLKKGKLEESSFTMERLRGNAMNLFLEGTESVGFTLQSLIHELSQHPEAQEEAQKELDAIVGRERLPSWLDRPKLPYAEALIHELFRVASAFLVSTHYSNFEETTIEGYRIPKRSIIIANLWSVNTDPSLFPNPEKFDPRRYLNSEGQKIKVEGPYPFGVGKRSCIGEALAQMEVFLVLTSLLQHFKIYPTDDEKNLLLISRE